MARDPLQWLCVEFRLLLKRVSALESEVAERPQKLKLVNLVPVQNILQAQYKDKAADVMEVPQVQYTDKLVEVVDAVEVPHVQCSDKISNVGISKIEGKAGFEGSDLRKVETNAKQQFNMLNATKSHSGGTLDMLADMKYKVEDEVSKTKTKTKTKTKAKNVRFAEAEDEVSKTKTETKTKTKAKNVRLADDSRGSDVTEEVRVQKHGPKHPFYRHVQEMLQKDQIAEREKQIRVVVVESPDAAVNAIIDVYNRAVEDELAMSQGVFLDGYEGSDDSDVERGLAMFGEYMACQNHDHFEDGSQDGYENSYDSDLERGLALYEEYMAGNHDHFEDG